MNLYGLICTLAGVLFGFFISCSSDSNEGQGPAVPTVDNSRCEIVQVNSIGFNQIYVLTIDGIDYVFIDGDGCTALAKHN